MGNAGDMVEAEYPNIKKVFKTVEDKMKAAEGERKRFERGWGEKMNDKKWELQ